jgi:sulfonate transport system substrate-binding protein
LFSASAAIWNDRDRVVDLTICAPTGADNRQFSGGSSAAIVHSERYLDQDLRDRPEVKVEWYFFKGAGPAVNEAFANNQLDFAIQGE